MKVAVIVPSVREQHLRAFLAAWSEEFKDATVHVVEDNAERTFDVEGAGVRHYAWEDIDSTLGDAAWIVPRRSGCVRSFGIYMAQRERPDMLVALDDDCLPDPAHPRFLARHWERLNESEEDAWVSSLDSTVPRGVPYHSRERRMPPVLNHGLWTNVPDFDAPTQLVSARLDLSASWHNQTIPRGRYFPMCSMNIAWRPELTPAMYFLLMGPDYAYDRFGDIWGGVLAKRVADHLGLAVNSGEPAIEHSRASNVWANLRKESRGLEVNETFWRAVDSVVLTRDTVLGSYVELADRLPLDDEYFRLLRRAMRQWTELLEAA